MSWTQLVQNQKSVTIKKFVAQILDQRIVVYDDLLTRISTALVTDNDFKAFAEMLNEILIAGYYKGVENYKEQLEKAGVKVNFSQNSVDNH